MSLWKIRIFAAIFLMALLAAGCGSPEDKKKAFFEKGKSLFEHQEYVKAKLEFKNAVQIDPEYADPHYMLGQIAVKENQFKTAFQMFKKTTELDPDNLDAKISLGRILLSARAVGRAEEQADIVLETEAFHPEATLLKASVLIVKNEIDPAKALLDRMAEKGQYLPELFLMLSSLERKDGDMDAARAHLRSGREKFPEHILLLTTLARLEAREKNFDAAEQLILGTISLEPDQIKHKFNLAGLYMAREDEKKAASYLDEMLAGAMDNEDPVLGVGSFWLQHNRADKAVSVVETALKHKNDSFKYRFFLAEIFAGDNRLEDAEPLLRQALELSKDPADPDIVRTKLALSRILSAGKKLEEAEQLVDQVLVEDPKNIDGRDLKGRFYLSRKDGLNAVSEFRVVTEERPENEQGHINLAQAHLMNKENELALDVLEKARQKLPESRSILMALAQMNNMNGQADAAEQNLKDLAALAPKDVNVLGAQGEFYTSREQYDRALDIFARIQEIRPDHSRSYIQRARIFVKQGATGSAVAELEKGYAKNYDSASILVALVEMYLKNRDTASAIALCEKRLEKNAGEVFSWNLLGSVYLHKKMYSKAKAHFEKAISLNPQWPKPYDNLAKLHLAQGNKDTAVKELKNALAENRQNRSAWLLLGGIHERDKAYEKAAAVYKEAFEAIPDLWPAANNYAFIRSETADWIDLDEALAYAKKAVALNNGSASVRDTLGWIHFKMGDLAGARREIEQALKKSPDNTVVNYHMGMILDREGKPHEAKIYFERALSGNRDFPGADTAREMMAQYRKKQIQGDG